MLKIPLQDCYMCQKKVPKGDPHGIPYLHSACARGLRLAQVAPVRHRTDPERILKEVGAKKLSETRDGQAVLAQVRDKYKAELVQPGDPEFKKLYGKQVKEREEARRENERVAQQMWADRGIKKGESRVIRP